MDPCEDLTDQDIRTAIQNASGLKTALFVPEVGIRIMYIDFWDLYFYIIQFISDFVTLFQH